MSWEPYFHIAVKRPWPEVVRIVRPNTKEMRRYVEEPPTCTMKPDGYYGEEYGIYKCSNCGELWQFECDGPKEHGWVCCPHCRATIEAVDK